MTGPEGLLAADAALQPLRQMAWLRSERLFDGREQDPGQTALAGALHKRLTGLRAEFMKDACDVVTLLNRKVAKETGAAETGTKKQLARSRRPTRMRRRGRSPSRPLPRRGKTVRRRS